MFIVVVPVVFVVVVPIVFVVVVLCGGRLRIVVVHHCRGLSWRYVLVVRVIIIRCGRVVLVRRRCHCPMLSAIIVVMHRGRGWWCVVIRGAGPRIVVIHRCPWLWPCLSVVCFVLVSCGCGPFVRARSQEERAVYLPGLRFFDAKRTLTPSLTSTSFLMWSSPILHQVAYVLIVCHPGPSPCGCESDDNEQRTVVVHRLVASCCGRHGTCVVCDYGNGEERRG